MSTPKSFIQRVICKSVILTGIGTVGVVLASCQSAGPVDASATGRNVGQSQSTFPAQQRALGDPEAIARGQALYGINCRSCHGIDLRGGDLGGPNLLRSQVVLEDLDGEIIAPVVLEGRIKPGQTSMPPIPLPESDIKAVVAYIHSVVASSQGQGAPPKGPEQELNILVGDADTGRDFFQQQCSTCHSVQGDLKGIASKISSSENLQNSWVAGRRWGVPDPDADPSRRQVKVTVTLETGEKFSGNLKRMDDFIVSLQTDNGKHRSFSRIGASPKVSDVDVSDPLQRHKELMSELDDDMMHNVTAYLATLK